MKIFFIFIISIFTNLTFASPCKNLNLKSAGVFPKIIGSGEKYQITCDYGEAVDSIYPETGSINNCKFLGNKNTAALFDCIAATKIGRTPHFCKLLAGTPSNTCEHSDYVSDLYINEKTITEFGIDRSNMVWISGSLEQANITRARMIKDMASLNAKWFRDGFFLPIHGDADLVNIVSNVKKNNMKMLAIITPSHQDYLANDKAYVNAGAKFKEICGWEIGTLPLSKMDLSVNGLFEKRLVSQFSALKKENLEIDAFEIGNELDWICFNGDIPFGKVATEADFNLMAQSYANFLEKSVNIIHDPKFFPNAKIITYGFANIDMADPVWRAKVENYYLKTPAKILARLKNLNGKNYLKSVDGYSTHIYPVASDIEKSIINTFQNNTLYLNDLPFWITEWGFRINGFKNSTDRSGALNTAMKTYLNKLKPKIALPFLYSYDSNSEDFGLYDANGVETPQLGFIKDFYLKNSK